MTEHPNERPVGPNCYTTTVDPVPETVLAIEGDMGMEESEIGDDQGSVSLSKGSLSPDRSELLSSGLTTDDDFHFESIEGQDES